MTTRTHTILVSIPAVLVSLFLILVSALPKFFMRDPAFVDMMNTLFGSMNILYAIALIEIACGVLLLIPRTMTLGFLMSVGLLSGAMATGLTTDIPGILWWFPLVLLALLCITAYFRLPELLDRVKGKSVPKTKSLTLRIIAWIFVVLLLAMHALALQGKIFPPVEGTEAYAMALSLGMVGLELPLLIVEVLTIVLFLIPRTSAIGFILMLGYMSGVLATFLTHGLRLMGSIPGFVMVAVVAMLGWIRNPELAKRLIKGKYPA